jgi:predicted 2-oxoglutarate/Fe(II)-dependent dioxygenase YbiX
MVTAGSSMISRGWVQLAILDEGMAPDWRRYSFDWQAGRPAVLMIAPQVGIDDVEHLIAGFRSAILTFRARNTDVLILSPAAQAAALRRRHVGECDIQIIDGNAEFFADSGTPMDEITVVVVDRNIRVALRCVAGPAERVVASCLECLDRVVSDVPAPVLILPNLLARDLCRTLIHRFECANAIEGKVAGIDAAGRPLCYVDRATKSRRDFQIPRDEPLYAKVQQVLVDRCAPEIAKAFQVEVAHTDRLMLARYDAPHGWFKRHRDNSSRNVAFRQFAISVNLNAGEYEGGYLTFPEYNDQPYSAPTGAGIIFSASLLHEVSHVTQGCRYVLLTFFHDEMAERNRRDRDSLREHVKIPRAS